MSDGSRHSSADSVAHMKRRQLSGRTFMWAAKGAPVAASSGGRLNAAHAQQQRHSQARACRRAARCSLPTRIGASTCRIFLWAVAVVRGLRTVDQQAREDKRLGRDGAASATPRTTAIAPRAGRRERHPPCSARKNVGHALVACYVFVCEEHDSDF